MGGWDAGAGCRSLETGHGAVPNTHPHRSRQSGRRSPTNTPPPPKYNDKPGEQKTYLHQGFILPAQPHLPSALSTEASALLWNMTANHFRVSASLSDNLRDAKGMKNTDKEIAPERWSGLKMGGEGEVNFTYHLQTTYTVRQCPDARAQSSAIKKKMI